MSMRWINAEAKVNVTIFDEEHEEDVVLVLAGVHAAAQLVTRCPEGGVDV